MILSTQEIDAVIFDLDGTLFDSMWVWGQIDIEFLGGFGIQLPLVSQEDIEGMSFSETAVYFKNRFNLPLEVEEIKERWIEMAMDKYSHQVRPKKGARAFVRHLKEREIKTAIASSNSHELINAVLEGNQMQDDIDAVAISCEVPRGKPAPDVYLLAAKRLQVEPGRCLVFEDIVAGILGAKRAGMRVWGIEDEYSRPNREEKQKLADGYITDFDEIELR